MRISDWSSDVCSSDLVEHQQPLVLQALGHVTVDDALRQPLDDRGLADAGLADQHRVVLGPPRQHLDGAADLLVAADHRIELAAARRLGQVAGVFLQRIEVALGVRAVGSSEEHTSELQSLMRSPYAVFCLKKKNKTTIHYNYI